MENLIQILQNITPLSEDLKAYLSENIKPTVYTKKHILLEPGQTSNRMYFVESGLLRGYYLKDGKEVTTWFMAENEFVISILSFYSQNPSYEYIEVLEDSKLWSLSYEKVQQAYSFFSNSTSLGESLQSVIMS